MTKFYSSEAVCTYVSANGTVVGFINHESEVPEELVEELTRVAADPSSHISPTQATADTDTTQVVEEIKAQAAQATLDDIMKAKTIR